MCITKTVFKISFGRHDGKMNILLKNNLPLLLGDYVYDLMDKVTVDSECLVSTYPHTIRTMWVDDKTKLKGYFFKNPQETNKLAVLIHGYNSRGLSDHAHNALFYLKNGYDVFMTANRGCDISGGDYTGFGILESRDTLKWINQLVEENKDYKIVIQGVSLGGATSCMLSHLDLPTNVKCIIADCPFKTLPAQLVQSAKLFHLPTFLLKPLNKICKKEAGYSFEDDSALNAVKEAKVPIFFIHGDIDKFIPCENSKELYEACSHKDKQLLIIEGAAHGSSNFINPEKYYSEIEKYLEKHIG
ncbi:MAG: alpha/beta hydrolase [Clostridia bacterium]|nr:alpha/beta hydrolase [Clostridia bacterium]